MRRRSRLRWFIPVLVIAACLGGFYKLKHHSAAKLVTSDQVQSISKSAAPSSAAIASSNSLSCPTGYILVPGNSAYQTLDFCVMKYEAKCAYITDPTVGIKPKPGDASFGIDAKTPEGVYKNNGVKSACVAANGRVVVSTASGSPITFIAGLDSTSDNATKYCDDVLAHLITNSEWMTIARNVEQVTYNWCNRDGTSCGAKPGTVGKILANGYNDFHNEPSASGGGICALVASTDDLPCFGTTTDGSNACGGKSSQKRTLTLSNGVVIWDLAGNVWEWTATTTALKDEPSSKTNGVVDTGWTTSDFATGASSSVLSDNGTGPTLGYDAFRPSNPAWSSAQGMGRIYHNSSSPSDTTGYDFLRGGNWRHGSDDGVYTIHLSPVLSKENIDDVGFRCTVPAQHS
jgi:hypothetical protein